MNYYDFPCWVILGLSVVTRCSWHVLVFPRRCHPVSVSLTMQNASTSSLCLTHSGPQTPFSHSESVSVLRNSPVSGCYSSSCPMTWISFHHNAVQEGGTSWGSGSVSHDSLHQDANITRRHWSAIEKSDQTLHMTFLFLISFSCFQMNHF